MQLVWVYQDLPLVWLTPWLKEKHPNDYEEKIKDRNNINRIISSIKNKSKPLPDLEPEQLSVVIPKYAQLFREELDEFRKTDKEGRYAQAESKYFQDIKTLLGKPQQGQQKDGKKDFKKKN